ncbi:hypothetical protein BABINDRAFT_5851 [Babjeviella inositovora NRRL Y-12698]|uniref:Glutaredoxin domain-containing protein n=1 Tax=Babjeviella inositovora NRRL Y-12698 TaxID=984486 RepID=A0A1E3R0R0_9ASCO|nr:uncharacterized protein BABINDRAFT_5851 [Babjeviella inositovora NRRL Y-12698]ODQ82967.1 hypothetical protein BABINDRAFT_5851 [Babjeviella inositovora NRRL Y-12698]
MASQESLNKVKTLIADNPFLMLSKSWCPDCHYTYKIWDEFGVRDKVHIIELDKFADQTEAAELEKAFTEVSGRKWVPTIWFNGERFGTEQDLKQLEKTGELESAFKSAKLI